MKVLKLSISCLLIFILSYGLSHAQNVELFGVARNTCVIDDVPATGSSLYRVNPSTGQATLIGDIGFEGVTGLAFLPDGRLVGSARQDTEQVNSAILIEINPATGAGSLIGGIGEEGVDGECGRAPDLSVDPLTNTLFATGAKCVRTNFLQTVNPATGEGTLIGTYDPFNGGGHGLGISDNRVFFVTPSSQQGFAVLITVDPNSGAPTFIADLTLDILVFVNALDFHPLTGELFGSTIDRTGPLNQGPSLLVKLNTTTGETTVVGDLPDCFDGIIFREVQPAMVPTLSEWGLIAMAGILGILGFMILRRRKVMA